MAAETDRRVGVRVRGVDGARQAAVEGDGVVKRAVTGRRCTGSSPRTNTTCRRFRARPRYTRIRWFSALGGKRLMKCSCGMPHLSAAILRISGSQRRTSSTSTSSTRQWVRSPGNRGPARAARCAARRLRHHGARACRHRDRLQLRLRTADGKGRDHDHAATRRCPVDHIGDGAPRVTSAREPRLRWINRYACGSPKVRPCYLGRSSQRDRQAASLPRRRPRQDPLRR